MSKKIKSVAYGKLGRSIIFKRQNWAAIGGDNEPPMLLQKLAELNPDVTFYLVGRSDFSRMDPTDRAAMFPLGNVVDCFEGYTKKSGVDRITLAERYFPDRGLPYPDVGLIWAGPTGQANIPNFLRKVKEPTEFAKPLEMLCGYAGPVISFLNRSQIPWATLVPDPRYWRPIAKDLFHQPAIALSQINGVETSRHITSHTDHTVIKTSVQLKYIGLETTFLLSQNAKVAAPSDDILGFDEATVPAEPVGEKTVKFMVVCNQGDPSFDRYKMLKKYVLDREDFSDAEVYGKWNDEIIASDARFKGPLKFDLLQAKLRHVKYTFMIPINLGWATAKWCEMAHYGIIPFMHPAYDAQNNAGLPAYLRVQDADELYAKIQELEADPVKYEALRAEVMSRLTPDRYDGTRLCGDIMRELEAL